MKKNIMIALLILVIFVFTGCSANDNNNINKSMPNKTKDGLKIVTTIFPQFDFTRNIIGDKGEVSMLLSPGAESHSYDPTPADIIKIQDSDIFIYVGGQSESWVSSILESMDTSNMKIISLMDCVNVVKEEEKEGMLHDEDEHEDELGNFGQKNITYDEHVWTSPLNAISITKTISAAICELDSINAEYYKDNTSTYIKELESLDIEFKDIVSSAKTNTIIVADRFPILYFVQQYGLDYWAAFPSCATETDPSISEMSFLIEKAKEHSVEIIFIVELSNGSIANAIAEEVGARVETFNTCHNITKDDFDNGEGYISLMKQNAIYLKEALK